MAEMDRELVDTSQKQAAGTNSFWSEIYRSLVPPDPSGSKPNEMPKSQDNIPTDSTLSSPRTDFPSFAYTQSQVGLFVDFGQLPQRQDRFNDSRKPKEKMVEKPTPSQGETGYVLLPVLYSECAPLPETSPTVDNPGLPAASAGAQPDAPPAVPAEAPPAVNGDQKPSWIQSVRNEILQQAVSQLLKDFGSEEFEVREAAENLAKTLPAAAIPMLTKGLTNEMPEVRMRAHTALVAIKVTSANRTIQAVKEITTEITNLCNSNRLSDDMRTQMEPMIARADAISISEDEINYALKLVPNPGYFKPGSSKAQFLRDDIKGANDLKSALRLWYALRLSENDQPGDREKAIRLMQEAVALPGWKKCPGLITGAIDRLGIKLEALPKELQDAYKNAYK